MTSIPGSARDRPNPIASSCRGPARRPRRRRSPGRPDGSGCVGVSLTPAARIPCGISCEERQRENSDRETDLGLRTGFAAAFRRSAPWPAVCVHSAPAADRLRGQASPRGLLHPLKLRADQPDDAGEVLDRDLRGVRGIAALKQVIRHPNVRSIAFPDRLAGATERIRAAGCDLLNC